MIISYDGSHYNGSQVQPHAQTVQGKLFEVFKILNIPCKCDFSGRTDKGVHAFRQGVSFDLPEHFNDLEKLTTIFNNLLPKNICVRHMCFVSNDFHARYSAKKREYRYLISKTPLSVFNQNYLGYYGKIDLAKAKAIALNFEGTHDFEYFSKTGSDPKTTIRTIYKIDFYEHKNLYILRFQGNSFLRSQIRMITEAIMKCCCGKISLSMILDQLQKEKKHTTTLANSGGLYLSRVIY